MNVIVEQINSAGFSFTRFAVPMLVQSGALIVILLLADLLLRKKVKAVFRYWIWMLVLVKLVLPASLSSPLSLGYLFGDKLSYQNLSETAPSPQPTVDTSYGIDSIYIQPNIYIPPTEPVTSIVETMKAEPTGPPPAPVTPLSRQGIVFLVWLAVVIAMGLLLLQRALFVRGLVAQAEQASPLMTDALENCRKSMKVKFRVGLKVSPNATTPSVCGLIRPVILVPWNLASTLGASRLRMVLMHELAHIKRADLWLNLAQTILQIIYFYNPLLWFANCMIRRIREQAVDETVLVAMGEKAQQYPQTLVSVAKLTFKRPALSLRLIGVVESESALAGRIKHILSRPIPKSAKLGLISILAIIITGAVLLPMAKAQKRTEAEEKIAAAKLRCEAELVKDKLAFGEEPQFLVRLINTTDKPIDIMGYSDEPNGQSVYRYPFPCAQVEITGYGMRSWDSAAAVPTAIRIEPGKSWSFEFPPPYVERWANEPARVVSYLTTYLTGKHTATVRYFIRENEKQRFGSILVFDEKMGALAGKKPDRLWEGVVESNTLTFEVLDDDSEQLMIRRAVDAGEGIKQYLQMELTCSKDKINAGDTVQLSLSARNTGRETLYLGSNYSLHWSGPQGRSSSFSGLGTATAREVKPAATLVLGGWNFGSGQTNVPGIYKVWVEYAPGKSVSGILKKSNTVKIEVLVAETASGYNHFVGRYALAKHPEEPVFEITKKGDVFIFSDLGGPKFAMEMVLKGLEGRRFEVEKGRDSLTFGENPRSRFRVRYNPSENRYSLDSVGMRGEVQDAVISPLTDLIKISAEKPEDKTDVQVEGEEVWGEAVEGVQVRLWVEKKIWRVDEEVILKADVRNQGKRDLMLDGRTGCFDVYVGAFRYSPDQNTIILVWPAPFGPGQHYNGRTIAFRRYPGLELAPGKHTIRVVLKARQNTTLGPCLSLGDLRWDVTEGDWVLAENYQPPVFASSNPVEIEILPAEDKTDVPVEDMKQRIARGPEQVQAIDKILREWLEACVARDVELMKNAYSTDYQLVERDMQETNELLGMNPVWRFSLLSVMWDEADAMAVSGAFQNADPKVASPMALVWTLKKIDRRWKLNDIDLEELEGLQIENSRFMHKHPNAQVWFVNPDLNAPKMRQKTDVTVEGEQGDEDSEAATSELTVPGPAKTRGGISGVVVSSVTGEPIAGAYVGVGDFGDAGGSNYSRHREEGFHDKTKTDEKGRFELKGLAFTDDHPYLKYHPLVVTHPDFVRHDEKIELLKDKPAPDVRVSLRPAAKIDVKIVDAQGNPLEGQWLIRLEALDGRRFITPGSDPHLSSFASSIWERSPDTRADKGLSNGFTFTELDTGRYSIEAIRFYLVDKPTPQNVWKPAITYHGSIPSLKIEAGRTEEVKLAPQNHQTKLTITPPDFPDVLMDELKVSSRMPLICIISRSPGAMLWNDGKIYHLEDQRLGRIDKKRFFRSLFPQGKPLIINNLPPDSYSFFAVAIYGQVAGCLIGARAELVKGDDITVDIPWRQPEGPSIVGPSPYFDYPVKLEDRDYSVSQLCEILTEITQSNPRIIADSSIENEKLSFGRGEMSIWDVLEKLYLDKGWKLDEGPDKTLIITSASKTGV